MKYSFCLYVTGRSRSSTRAIRNIQEVCSTSLQDYELEVVDVLEHPQRAEQEKIMATPTLIRYRPPPVQKIIGDLNDQDKLRTELDLPTPRENR